MLVPTDYEIAEVESGEEALTAIAKQRFSDDKLLRRAWLKVPPKIR
jgi:hypothetical protein